MMYFRKKKHWQTGMFIWLDDMLKEQELKYQMSGKNVSAINVKHFYTLVQIIESDCIHIKEKVHISP